MQHLMVLVTDLLAAAGFFLFPEQVSTHPSTRNVCTCVDALMLTHANASRVSYCYLGDSACLSRVAERSGLRLGGCERMPLHHMHLMQDHECSVCRMHRFCMARAWMVVLSAAPQGCCV
jgi:hypothetical protein